MKALTTPYLPAALLLAAGYLLDWGATATRQIVTGSMNPILTYSLFYLSASLCITALLAWLLLSLGASRRRSAAAWISLGLGLLVLLLTSPLIMYSYSLGTALRASVVLGRQTYLSLAGAGLVVSALVNLIQPPRSIAPLKSNG